MLELHPNILRKNGKEEFVVLPYEEYVAIQDLLEDAEDLRLLREAKAAEGDAPTLSAEEVKRRYELRHPRKAGARRRPQPNGAAR